MAQVKASQEIIWPWPKVRLLYVYKDGNCTSNFLPSAADVCLVRLVSVSVYTSTISNRALYGNGKYCGNFP